MKATGLARWSTSLRTRIDHHGLSKPSNSGTARKTQRK
jgi:hypothetical protein